MRPSDSSGFTLVEVLVALGVFSGLMLALFSSYNAFTNSAKLIREASEASTSIRMDIITADLEQIFIPPYREFLSLENGEESIDQPAFELIAARETAGGRQVSSLAFAGCSPVRFGTPAGMPRGIARILYYVREEGERLDLLRSDRPAWAFGDEDERLPCSDAVVARDIRGFDLVLYDEEDGEFEVWDSADSEHDHAFPARIGIRITYGTEEQPKEARASVIIVPDREAES